jgi:acyl carrier protein
MEPKLKERLARYISTELLNQSGLAIDDDEDLLASGLLDSLSVMSVVYFIEQETGIDVPAEDVTIENFESLAAIEAYLGRRAAG